MTRYRWALALSLAFTLSALVAASTAGGAHKQKGVSGNLSIIAKWTGDEQTAFKAVLAGFTKANPNVKIKYQGAGDDAPTIISTAIAGGNPPDIGTMPQPGTMADFAKRGKLKPRPTWTIGLAPTCSRQRMTTLTAGTDWAASAHDEGLSYFDRKAAEGRGRMRADT